MWKNLSDEVKLVIVAVILLAIIAAGFVIASRTTGPSKSYLHGGEVKPEGGQRPWK